MRDSHCTAEAKAVKFQAKEDNQKVGLIFFRMTAVP